MEIDSNLGGINFLHLASGLGELGLPSSATPSKLCVSLPVADREKHPILNDRISNGPITLEWN